MFQAHRELLRIRRDRASLAEIPIASLAALTANLNRDPDKGKPFTAADFCLFAKQDSSNTPVSPEVAAVALDLRHQDIAPPLLLSVWPQILESIKEGTPVPKVRALRSDDEVVWILAPTWEQRSIRAGLVLVRGRPSGPVTLRDLDKPLMTYRLVLPERPGFGWVEADLLLLQAVET